MLALDNIPSRVDGNDTLVILNRTGGNLATGASSIGSIFGLLYNDAENVLSFTTSGGCQKRFSISNTERARFRASRRSSRAAAAAG